MRLARGPRQRHAVMENYKRERVYQHFLRASSIRLQLMQKL